ncbi:MAG: PorP/SprF family type IX secretion system membrane protein [Flavobacteriales bacterium]
MSFPAIPPDARLRARGPWLLAAFLLATRMLAQDIHFSQFFNTPYAQSPANTGLFDGDHRLGAVYRQQWRSVTLPYTTFGLGGDMAHFAKVDGLGLGAWFYGDKTGDSRLSTFQFTLGVSWTQRFGTHKEQSLTLGVQGGLTSLTIDYSALRFDAQYNGFYFDPSLSSNEQFTRDARTHPDLHAGLIYRYAPSRRERIEAGFALFNLTTPDIAFFNAAPSALDQRAMFHVTTQFPVSGKVDVLPMARYMAQGTFRELDLGGTARYILLDRYGVVQAVQAGLFWRAADAGYLYAGLEYADWTLGVSYDINLSRLEPASRNRGGIEVTAVRVFRKKPVVPVRFKACPDQI